MYDFFIEGSIMLSLIVILLLLFFSKRNNSQNILLGITLFCICYSLLINNLHVTKAIFEYPYLIRTGNITGYLILPFLYFYTRSTFYPDRKFRPTDLLLILPSVLYLIDMFPFFMSDAAIKVAITKMNLDNPARLFQIAEGWIGIRGFHFVFRYITALAVMIFQIRLIYFNRNLCINSTNRSNRKLFIFIASITGLLLPLIIPGIFGVILHLDWYSLSFLNINLAMVLFAASLFILFSPSVLYGFFPKPVIQHYNETEALLISNNGYHAVSKHVVTNSKMFRESNDLLKIISKVEQLMLARKPYLDKGYTIHDLGKEIHVPVYQLSPIINQHYKANFSSWINKYRVEYFLSLYDQMGKKEMTLDALAMESGFYNRTTFINAFKKEKNDTPGNYLRRKHLQLNK